MTSLYIVLEVFIMKKNLFTLLIFIVLFLASCSDETDVENGTAQNEETSEKNKFDLFSRKEKLNCASRCLAFGVHLR